MSEWERIGECWVDSGQIMLVDPCYVLPDRRHIDVVPLDYDDILEEWEEERNKEVFHIHLRLATIVRTLYGDGSYPIYVKKDKYGGIKQVMIDFEEEYWEGE